MQRWAKFQIVADYCPCFPAVSDKGLMGQNNQIKKVNSLWFPSLGSGPSSPEYCTFLTKAGHLVPRCTERLFHIECLLCCVIDAVNIGLSE